MIIVSSGSGTVTNINTTAPLSGGPITTSGTITTAMATNKLIGRSTAGTGTMEEITVGTGLSLSGGTLSSTPSGAAGNTNEIQFNNAGAFAADLDLRWIIASNRLVLGQENTADTNSRMVVIGKGISTNNTFAVHNLTGTNNALVVRDDGRVGIGTNAPATPFQVTLIPNTFIQFHIPDNQRPEIRLTNNGGETGHIQMYGSGTGMRIGVNNHINAINLTNNTVWVGGNNPVAVNGQVQVVTSTTDPQVNLYGNGLIFSVRKTGVTIGDMTGHISPNWRLRVSGTDTSASTYNTLWRDSSNNILAVIRNNGFFGIGQNTDLPSAILAITSTTRGFLPPRMTTSDVNNIATPATGLTVYNTTENTLCFYNGTSWQKVNHSNL